MLLSLAVVYLSSVVNKCLLTGGCGTILLFKINKMMMMNLMMNHRSSSLRMTFLIRIRIRTNYFGFSYGYLVFKQIKISVKTAIRFSNISKLIKNIRR